MAGTRYGHKIKSRLKTGNASLSKEKGNTKTDFHIQLPKDCIGIDELADLFFTNKEKIKKAHRLGIIIAFNTNNPNGKRPKKFFFKYNDAVNSLSKFKDKNGFLMI